MFPTPASFPLMLKCFVQHPFASVELMSIAPLANPAGPVFLLCPPILGPLVHNEDGSERFAVLMLVETSREVELHIELLNILTGEKHIVPVRSEEHTSELQSIMRISYAGL